jgi:L-glyceraldehyde 3-phosphate reductase
VAAVQRLEFSSDELAEIDRYAVESGVDLWAEARETPAVQTAF